MRSMDASRRVTRTSRGRKTGCTSLPSERTSSSARSEIEVCLPVPTLST